MQLNLKSQQENELEQSKEHRIVLIERHSNENENQKNDSPLNVNKTRRAITLKAVRMSSMGTGGVASLNKSRDREEIKNLISAETNREKSQTDSPSSLDSSKVKLNIFSTHLP